MYNISRLKQDLTGVIHGTTLNKVVNLNGIINRAARQVLQDIDPQETKRILQFATPIFDNVFSYALAPDVKGNAIIDIRPQVNRLPGEVFNQDYNQQFSLAQLTALNNQFTIQWNQGVRTILVNAPLLNTGVIVNYASSLNQNGTWAAGGDAVNLTVNPVNYLAGGGALMFDLVPSGEGAELVTNGGFSGNANGWTLGTGWAYGSNNVVHTVGNTNSLEQAGLDIPPGPEADQFVYQVSFDVTRNAGTLNFVQMKTAGGSSLNILTNIAVSGTQTTTFSYPLSEFGEVLTKISFSPDTDFDGSITNVSIKRIGNNTGYLETSDMQAVNLEDFVNFATWFLYTYLPTTSASTVFSQIDLNFGSSPSDYYTVSATQTQAQTAFENGWNLLSYLWNGATQTGTIDASAITYLNIVWHYDGTAQTGVMLNDIASRLGQIMEYEYYSKYLFADNITGDFQETVTDDSNFINLDTDSYNILFNQVAYLTMQQLQGLDASFYDGNFFLQQYMGEVQRYKELYKSEKQKPRQLYYGIPKPGYNSWLPRRWNQ